MCVKAIVDACVIHRVLVSRADNSGDPVFRGWIKSGNGILVFSETNRLLGEQRNKKLTALVGSYLRFGRAQRVSSAAVTEETTRLEGRTRSDDPHILALAKVADALVLCTDDGSDRGARLIADFKDTILLPKVGGRRRRAIYPIDADRRTRRRFVERRKCPHAAT